MKVIYINLDPFVSAIANGTALPAVPAIPLAVTVPVGQSVGVYCQTGTATGITGITWSGVSGDGVSAALGLSAVLASESGAVYAVGGNTLALTATVKNSDTTVATIPVNVSIIREAASGPIDLIDWQEPAAAQDLKGATFNDNEIVADADTGALSAPAGG